MRVVLYLGIVTFGLGCSATLEDENGTVADIPRHNVTLTDCFAVLRPRSDDSSIEIQRWVLSDDSAEIWRATERVPLPGRTSGFTFEARAAWLRTEPGVRGECALVDGSSPYSVTLMLEPGIPLGGLPLALSEYMVTTGQASQWRAGFTMEPDETQPAWFSSEYVEGGCDIVPCGSETACVLRKRADLICPPTP